MFQSPLAGATGSKNGRGGGFKGGGGAGGGLWRAAVQTPSLANHGFEFTVPVHFHLAMPLFNREMKIFSGTAHKELALKIAESVGVPLADATVTSFPDAESRVKINEKIRGRYYFIVQPPCPPTNHNLMELLILIDAARRASAYRITAVIPYFGYARQDRKDQPRVPINAKLVTNLLTAARSNRVVTRNLH